MTGIIGSIIIGILAGFFANKIMGGNGSLLWNLLLGVVGGALGGWLLPLLGISSERPSWARCSCSGLLR